MVHKIGIDLGNTKTVIYSSKSNGTVITDDLDKREIATVLELTKPKRFFGKACCSDNVENINLRHRQFIKNLSDHKNRECMFMWLEHIHRICSRDNYKTAVLSIPEYFSLQERSILRQLCEASSLNTSGFVTHMTALGSYAGLLCAHIPPEYLIMDFGNHRSSIGIFNKKDKKVIPISRYCITRGAADYDEAIFRLVCEKYGFSDSKIMRERILSVTDKIKKAMNTLDEVKVVVLDEKYQNVDVIITSKEYLERTKVITEEIKFFIQTVLKETDFKGHIEVVGKNYQNKQIKNLVKDLEIKTLLHSSESAAHGACMYLAVNTNKDYGYSVEEIITSEITATVGEEDVVLFNKGDFIGLKRKIKFESCAIANSVDNEFNFIELKENGVPFAKINFKTEELNGFVSVEVGFDSFLLFNVYKSEKVVGEKTEELKYVYDSFKLSNDEILKCVDSEKEIVDAENLYKKAGEIRHKTERIFDNLDSQLREKFSELFTDEDYKKINDVIDEYFDLDASKDFEVEKKNSEMFLNKLKFVSDKLEDYESILHEKTNEFIKNSEKTLKNSEFLNTKAGTQLHKLKTEARHFIKNSKLSLETLEGYSSVIVKDIEGKFEELKKKAEVEIENKRKEEEEIKKKKEELAAKKEAERKAKEEAAKKEEKEGENVTEKEEKIDEPSDKADHK